MSRRSALRRITGGTAALAAVAGMPHRLPAADEADRPKLKGNIHHSVSAWCYGSLFNAGKDKPAKMTFEDFCRECDKLGLESVELLGPNEWPTVKKAGLTCAMCNGPDSIPYGWNRVEHHDVLLPKFEKAIPAGGRVRLSEHHHLLRQPQGHERRGGPGELRERAEAAGAHRREAQGHRLHGTAQQQAQPQGLHVRPHRLGRRGRASASARSASSCSTTSSTCRSWKAT